MVPLSLFTPFKTIEQALGTINTTLDAHLYSTLGKKLDHLNSKLERIAKHMANIDDATNNLEKLVTVGDGMVSLLGTLNEEIRNLKSSHTDSQTAAKIDQLNKIIEENMEEWTVAVKANTPAEDEGDGVTEPTEDPIGEG